ncbi:MAG: hypothetical protein Q8858_16805 [Bacteroidota bacterium]|nr:hypothetical protein [Bacteroidota bacterium]
MKNIFGWGTDRAEIVLPEDYFRIKCSSAASLIVLHKKAALVS